MNEARPQDGSSGQTPSLLGGFASRVLVTLALSTRVVAAADGPPTALKDVPTDLGKGLNTPAEAQPQGPR